MDEWLDHVPLENVENEEEMDPNISENAENDNNIMFEKVFVKANPDLEKPLRIDAMLEQRDKIMFEEREPKYKNRTVVCTHYLRGLCQFEDYDCRNLHVYDPNLFPLCQFYVRGSNHCTNPDCIFRHPDINEQIECKAYAKGFCKEGAACNRFHKKRSATELSNAHHYVEMAIQSEQREWQRCRDILKMEKPGNNHLTKPKSTFANGQKKPCHTFARTGSCRFGDKCIYSHQS